MKKLLLLLFVINCFGQAPSIVWQGYYGGTKAETARCVKSTSDGGYIVAAYTYSNDGQVTGLHGSIEDFWIIKLSSNGTIEWQKAYGGNGDEEAYSITQTNDGGYIVAGYATYPDSGDVTGIHSNDAREDFWIIKLSNSGVLEWQKTFGGTMNEVAKDIRQTSDGGYIVIGSTISNDFDVSGLHGILNDVWVVKLSATGIIEWQKTYGGTNYEYGNSITQSLDGGYVFTGSSRSGDGDLTGIQASNPNPNMWIVKINSTGTIVWQKIISGGSEGYKINTTSSGEYIILGSAIATGAFTNPSGPSYGYNGVLKLSTSGTIVWARTYGDYNGGIFYGNIIQSFDGNYVFSTTISSATGDVTAFNGGIWVVKINSLNGNILWQKSVGRTDANSAAHYLDQANDNSYVVCGNIVSSASFPGYHGGGSDVFVAKLSADSLSISEFDSNKLILFPNPASNLLEIQISNVNDIDKIIVTDITGKIILTKSENTTQINTQSLSNGIYIIQVFSKDVKYQSKFIKQ